MAYDVKLIGAKLRRWENYLNNFHLPQWDELPDMDLYMDQVVMYLIMVCSLKQSVNIPYIQKMLPLGLPESEVRRIYEEYVKTHHDVCLAFIQLVRAAGDDVLHSPAAQSVDVERLIYSSAIVSGFSKLLTEKMVHLEGATLDGQPESEVGLKRR